MKSFDSFLQLHRQAHPLMIANIWDVKSAKVVAEAGYQALATSSAAVAHSFGYDDGEQLPFSLIVQLAKRVNETTALPLSVDIEGGFSRSIDGICRNIRQLIDVGVVGINIEDSVPGNARALQKPDHFRKTLDGIVNYLQQSNARLFINVRTDAFLTGHPDALNETLLRVRAYHDSGAHGIFVPCIVQSADIKAVVDGSSLPVNVMCMPQLPAFNELKDLGVKRISMGNTVHQHVYEHFRRVLETIRNEDTFASLF